MNLREPEMPYCRDAFREEVRLGLEDAGYEVTVMSCGECGVEAFKSGRQDVVITDVVMDKGKASRPCGSCSNWLPNFRLSPFQPMRTTFKR